MPKGPGEGALLAELMDKESNQRQLVGVTHASLSGFRAILSNRQCLCRRYKNYTENCYEIKLLYRTQAIENT
jgi:hypothetical protein